MANRVLDEWTGPDAYKENFYELPTGKERVKVYRLVESLEQGVVIERWLEMRMLGARWEIVEDTDHAYFILRDRLADMIMESKNGVLSE